MKTEPLILSSRATYLNYLFLISLDLVFGFGIRNEFIKYLSSPDKDTLTSCLIGLFLVPFVSWAILRDANKVWIDGDKIFVKNIFGKKEFDLENFDCIDRSWNTNGWRINFLDESSYNFSLRSKYAFSFKKKTLDALNAQINEMKKNLPA